MDLPSDVLYHIFLAVSDDGHITLDTSTGIWVLSRVCHRWRSVSFDFKGLWSRISIDQYQVESFSPHAVSIVRTALIRSGPDTPLRIRAYLDRLLVHANILDVLVKESHRWHVLDLQISLFLLRDLGTKMKSKRSGFPMLSKLSLSLVDNDGPGGASFRGDPLDAFQRAPKLESVTVNTRRSSLVKLPWSNLLHLSMREISAGEFLRVFGSTTNLVECSLLVSPPYRYQADVNATANANAALNTVDTDPDTILRQSSLQTLLLRSTPSVLNSLELPSLTKLYIAEPTTHQHQQHQYHNQHAFSFTPLISLVHRSFCDIQVLGLSGILFEEYDDDSYAYDSFDDCDVRRKGDGTLHNTLLSLPNLVSLTLADWTRATPESNSLNNLVADLIIPSPFDDMQVYKEPLVPKLRSLVIDDYSSSGRRVDGDLLASLVESRSVSLSNANSSFVSGCGLEKLAIHGVSLVLPSPSVLIRFRQFKEEMEFVVTVGHSKKGVDVVERNFDFGVGFGAGRGMGRVY
ncbi:hypothetical protein VKT23_018079 [Stygiomarasmius scandens]|uniref:F-box domain-containing protein n=1 Tax=Marasmiellus scandens TaxID=2682957 RepID=A0ABR1ISS4_9AGAR